MGERDEKGAAKLAGEDATPGIQRIDRRYEVDVGTRLPEFDSPHAMAYSVRDRENPRASLFALVVEPGIAWRGATIVAQRPIRHPSVLQVMAIGPVTAADPTQRQAAIIIERPVGARLSKRHGILKEDVLREVLLPAMLDGLQALHAKGITHRALRPDNIFFLNEREDALAIGECVSALPGYDQPADLEPIDRAAASPEGRGDGTPACDLYALGATLARLSGGKPPPDHDPEQRLIARMERGSFEVIAGEIKCSAPIRELIAGLMADDPAHRWTIEDVRAWILNPRAGAPSVVQPRNGTRPYSFQGHSATQPRVVVHLYSHNVEAARQDLQRGHLSRWVRSSLGHNDLADAIEVLVGRPDELARTPRMIDEDLVSRICCMLDPIGPVTYRGLSIMADGFVGAISQVALAGDGDALKTIVAMINLNLPLTALRSPIAPDNLKDLEARQSALRATIRSKYAEAGLERVLYELDPELPCLSPLVRDQLPIGPARYLRALDRWLRIGNDFSPGPIDRHGSAYIAARLPPDMQKKARSLGFKLRNRAGDTASDLATLSFLQDNFEAGPVPHLARWLSEHITSAFDGVRNVERRARMIASLKTTAQAGDLGAMLEVLLDLREFRADNDEFRQALSRYLTLGDEIEELMCGTRRRTLAAVLIGRRAAAAIGGLVFAGASLVSLLGSLG
jgi:hypothetical protein